MALWARRIVLICIAGVVSILSGLSLVMRFFGGQLKRPVLRAPKVASTLRFRLIGNHPHLDWFTIVSLETK